MARTALRAPPNVFPRALLLALLVHVWLALSLTARPERSTTGPGGWGRLEITLTGPGGTALGGDTSAPQPTWRDDGPEGDAPTPRHGGRVRTQAPPPDAGPGAATQGRWQPQATPPDPSRPDDDTAPAKAQTSTPPTPAPQEAAPVPPTPTAAVPREAAPAPDAEPPPPAPEPEPPALTRTLPRDAGPVLTRPSTERVVAPSPFATLTAPLNAAPALPEVPAAPTLRTLEAPAPAPALASREALSSPLRPSVNRTAALPSAPTLPEVPPAPTLRTLDAPARAPSLATREPVRAAVSAALSPSPLASAPTLPEPPPTLRTLDAPARAPALASRDSLRSPVAAPAVQQAAPLAAAPTLPDVPPAPTLRTLDTPNRTERRVARSLLGTGVPTRPDHVEPELARAPALPEVPAAPTLRTLDAPARAPGRTATETVSATPGPTLAERLTPLPTDALARDLPPARPDARSAPPNAAVSLRGDRLDAPTPGPLGAAGSPDAGAQVGHDVATAPSATASAPPRPLNLALPRSAGPNARNSTGLLQLLPAVPDTKSKIEKAMEEAGREDCRKAHADKGLLGAIPLALDSARGKGCKW